MNKRSILVSASFIAAAALSFPDPAGATVVMAPVFDGVPGEGPTVPFFNEDGTTNDEAFQTYDGPDPLYTGAFVLGFYNPGVAATSLTADEPGEILTYGAGYPADPTLVTDTLFSNNTDYIITGFTLHIAGYAEQQSDDPLDVLFIEDPDVDAVWGDTAEGNIQSDIFSSWEISEDGKTITFSGGHIGVGDIFTDYMFAALVGNHEDFTPDNPFAQNIAYIEASFQGRPVPVPAAAPLMAAGLAAFGGLMRRKRARRS